MLPSARLLSSDDALLRELLISSDALAHTTIAPNLPAADALPDESAAEESKAVTDASRATVSEPQQTHHKPKRPDSVAEPSNIAEPGLEVLAEADDLDQARRRELAGAYWWCLSMEASGNAPPIPSEICAITQ